MKKFIYTALACLMALLLTSCGGQSPTEARAPVFAAQVQSAQQPRVASDYHKVVQQMYVGYFGRPADPAGLAWFAGRFHTLGAPADIAAMRTAYDSDPDVRALIDVFGTSQESKDFYPGDNGVFIDAVYRNLFGREPDPVGKNFWVNAINVGAMTRASAAVNVMAGAQQLDIDTIARKSAAAASFTISLNTTQRAKAYDGPTANAIARTVLAGVTLDTDPAAIQPAIDAAVATLVSKLPPAAEGMYVGSLAGGTSFHLLVLDDDQYWGFHGRTVGQQLQPYGFVQGQGASSGGNFSSADMRDFGANPAQAGTVSATYVAKTSLDGTIGTPTGSITFATPVVTGSAYNYDAAASLADIAGAWRLAGPVGTTSVYAVNVEANGSFSGSTLGCSYTGTLKPRLSGKNVFDAAWTFGAGSCALSNQAATGVAFSYLFNEGATRQLFMTGVNAARSTGTIVSGAAATPIGQVAAFSATDTLPGAGVEALAGKTITVHYTGWLYNANAAGLRSTKFDSSLDRGPPFSFVLGTGAVIQGWDQGFAGMRVGGKRTLNIPASMGYGASGSGTIPANAGLVFDVELLSVK